MLLIRPASVADAPLLRSMIRELADFEHELQFCIIEADQLVRDGFGPNPGFRALVAEWDQQPAGYALFFDSYSTWVGPGLFLEDLFVREAFRGKGIGTALLSAVARIAVKECRYGVRWEALNWNEKAIELYKSLGAQLRDGWRNFLITGHALHLLAEKSL